MDDNVIDTLRIEIEGDSTNAVQGLEQLISTLERLRSTTQNIQPPNFDTTTVNEALSGFTQIQQSVQQATAATENFNQATQNVNVDQFVRSQSQVDLLTMKLNDAKARLQELLNSGNTDSAAVANLTMQIQSLQDKITAATSKTSIFKSVLSGVKKVAVGASSALLKMAKAPFSALGKAVDGAKEKFGGFLTMFKKRLMYRLINSVISAVTNAVKEGVKNVYQYSKAFGGTFSQSMDRAATSMLYFKNSIGAMVAPLINLLVPALEWVINKVVSFINVLNQLFAKLSGASTWTKALMYPKEYAEATNDATAANKKFKASILGIDELNVMQDNSPSASGGGNAGDDYSQMFEEVALNGESLFGDFFKPFKDAWENEGMATINAIKRMFGSFKGLFQSIGKSFKEVWQNGTGQHTVETLLRITQNIANFWANIADNIKKAWDENGTGTRIVQAAWDILNSILDTIDRISAATAEWAANLNFSPLLEAVANFLEKLKPLIDIIGQAIEWIWVNIILPIGTWLIESALPDVINALGGLIDFLVGVFTGDWELAWQGICDFVSNIWKLIWEDTLYPIVMWVYENVLVPIGNFFAEVWTGIKETVVGVWDSICEVWGTVCDWFNTNIIQPISEFFTGLWEGISSAASTCWNAIVEFFSPAVEWFGELFGSIWQTISDIFYNIGVIASGCWEIIKRVWAIVSEWFNVHVVQPVSNFFSNLWNGIKNAAVTAWNAIKSFLAPIVNWFNANIIQPLSNFFSNLWNGFKEKARAAWEGVKQVFSKVAEFFGNIFRNAWAGIVKVFSIAGEIFTDIKDGVVTAFKWVVNGIINGINKVVAVPFNAINGVLRWLRDITIVGIQPFSGIKEINVPQIPNLAEGGMLNAGTMFVAGEAGAEVVAQIGRHTGVMNTDEMRESVAQGVVDANAEQNALLREEISILRRLLDKDWDVTTYLSTGNLIDGLARKNRRDGKTVVPVGT